jgi:hypothetical protein
MFLRYCLWQVLCSYAIAYCRAFVPMLLPTVRPIFLHYCLLQGLCSTLSELQALVAPKLPQGVLARGHAGLIINKLSRLSSRRT